MIYQHPLAYLLGVEGAALLRAFAGEHDRDFTLARIAEVRAFVEAADDWGDGVTLSSVTTPEGYRTWAETYDQPGNQLVDLEQPVVREILHDLPVGLALDVACGTGRHAGYLAELGHRVIGVDSAQAMLDRAAANVPDASLSRADLHQLPVPDHAVDVVVCALALTHVPDLGAALTEFVRVLRPGGHLVISDSRGLFGYFGAPVPVRTSDGGPGVLPHWNRLASDYLAAALPLGLHVRRCVEPAGQPRSSTPTPGPRSRTWRRTTHRASGSSTRSARPPRTPPTATTRRPSSGTSKSSGDRRRDRPSPGAPVGMRRPPCRAGARCRAASTLTTCQRSPWL